MIAPPPPPGLTRAAAALLCCALASAQSAARPPDPELRARFGFRGPVVHKVGQGINQLQVADLDGGGGEEVVVYHGRRGRVEVLSLNGGEVTTTSERTLGDVHGLRVADVDGDGTADLMLVTARGRLEVRLRGDRPRELTPIDVGQAAIAGCLRAGDLDGDGRADAVVLVRDGLRTVTGIAKRPSVSAPVPLQESRIRAFDLVDLDADGHLDVFVATSGERHALRLALGRGAGDFGPWILLDVPRVTSAFAGTGRGGRPTLALIEGAHRRVVEYELRSGARAARPALRLTALPARTRPGAAAFAHGDLDGDGDLDLVVADPERAQLTFLLEDDGHFDLRTAPTLAGIGSLAMGDLDGDGAQDLVLASSEEAALAWKSGARPLDAFPERLPAADMPAAVAVHERALWLLTRDKRRNGTLRRLPWADGGAGALETVVETGRLSDDPLRLLVMDLHDHPGPEVAFVAPGVGLQVLLRDAGGAFAVPDPKDGPGFTSKMEDGALAPVTRGEGAALMVVRDRFARVFRLDGDGQPAILEQINAPGAAVEFALGAVTADGAPLFLDRKASVLHRLGPSPRSVDVPSIGATHLLAHHGAALVLGAQGVLRVPFDASYELAALRTWEPPADKTNYWAGLAADLDGDGVRDLALLDEHLHGLHLLVADDRRLRPALSFPVFELPEAKDDVYEPREAAAGDVDGDGRIDLVLIAHDRVLIYLQEP